MSRSPITTHVLDTATGKPAEGVLARLSHLGPQGWTELGEGRTNADGRITDLMPVEPRPAAGVYRMHFDTEGYWKAQGVAGFYPHVEVVFHLTEPEAHHHIPLLLSPFGYSTYRGS